MADATSITNLALAKLGVSPVMSIDDASKPAQFANRFYGQTRDEVLAEHQWNFAMKRARLNRLASHPDFGWKFCYALPIDCLRVTQLNGYGATERPGYFAVESGKLLTDADVADIRFISRVVDGSIYPPLFVSALAVKLASLLAGPLIGSRSLPQDLLREYEAMTGPRARLVDAFEGRGRRKQPWVNSDLVASRHRRI